MPPRVPVPKLFRRSDRWSVRVQVPKEMQSALGKTEYWISLKTSDRQIAMQRAPDVVRAKRAEITLAFNQEMGLWRPVRSFTDEERLSLNREAYQAFTPPEESLVVLYEFSGFDSLAGFLDFYEKDLSKTIQDLKETRGRTERIDNMMQALAKRNGISLVSGSQAEQDLRKICVGSYIESRRYEIAVARGLSIQSNPNLKIVDPETGLAKDYTPLAEILARPTIQPSSLTRMVTEFLDDPNKLRTKKTKSSMRGYLGVVIEILGDDTPPGRITEEDCIRVRDLIMQLPPNFMKLAPLKNRPIEEMVRIARQRDMHRLTPTGVNNYLKHLMAFLTWCLRRRKIDRMPTALSEIQVADPVRKENKRLPFSTGQLSTIYHSEVFVDDRRHECMFWVPLIALWNGMRSNEICQLDAVDVKEVEGVWCFDITDVSAEIDGDKRIKTNSSNRLVPIHPKLLEFGFLGFCGTRKAGEKLFGDITIGHDGYYSTTFSKRSNRYLKKIGVHGPKYVFHSLRHNFKDAMQLGRVDIEVAKALGGWTRGKTDAFEIYGSGYSLDKLYSELALVDYPDVDWTHLVPLK